VAIRCEYLGNAPVQPQSHEGDGCCRHLYAQFVADGAQEALLPEFECEPALTGIEAETRQGHTLVQRAALVVVEKTDHHPFLEGHLHAHCKDLRLRALEKIDGARCFSKCGKDFLHDVQAQGIEVRQAIAADHGASRQSNDGGRDLRL
jgi:hypothetical protein